MSDTAAMVRVLIVDDHALIREGLRSVIADAFPQNSIGEASNSAEAMNLVWNESWDIVLLDINLPGRNGLELLKEIKAARPKMPVLMVSGHPEEQFATRSLKSGASGYVSKNGPPESLIQAIRQARAGRMFITSKTAEMLATQLTQDTERPLHEQLSDREYDVFIRIGRGQGVSEIAASLNLSVKTISTYRTRILDKMGVRSNAALAQYAIRNNLVD
jgi:two-component system invasion response regulator UvrY